MAEAPKSSKPARLPKSPPTSCQPSSRDTRGTCNQQHCPVNREWATPTKNEYFQHYAQNEHNKTKLTYDQADAQCLSPMERWEKENLRQSPWNNIASYAVATNALDHQSNKDSEGQDESWSMTGNAPSEK